MSGSGVTFKKDEVLVLLGAGASVDAGIPHSAEMVRQIEAALEKDWKDYKEL
jgi:NAD-dependent SIR2 family protein deacetylase